MERVYVFLLREATAGGRSLRVVFNFQLKTVFVRPCPANSFHDNYESFTRVKLILGDNVKFELAEYNGAIEFFSLINSIWVEI